MARRNKKKRKVEGFIFPAPFAGVVVLLALTALCYVWLGIRCEALGREIKGLEREKDELNKKLQNEQYRWAQIKSPRNVHRALAAHGISMSWPLRTQVVRLYERADDVHRLARDAEQRHAYASLRRTVRNE